MRCDARGTDNRGTAAEGKCDAPAASMCGVRSLANGRPWILWATRVSNARPNARETAMYFVTVAVGTAL
jgi:hypothetical protein